MERIKTDEPAAEPRAMASCSSRTTAHETPPWLNWLYLLIFLWSSWQLAGMWWQRLHG